MVESLPGACGDGSAGAHLAAGRRVTRAPSHPAAGVRACLPALAGALETDARLDSAALAHFLAAQVEAGLVHGSRPLCRVLSPLVICRRAVSPGRTRRRAGPVGDGAAGGARADRRRAGDPSRHRRRRARAARHRPRLCTGAGGRTARHGLPRAGLRRRRGGRIHVPRAQRRFARRHHRPGGRRGDALRRSPRCARRSPPVARCRWPRRVRCSVRCWPATATGEAAGVPRVAIVDWAALDTAAEQQLLQRAFAEQGIPTVLAAPDALHWDGRRLCAAGGARGPGVPAADRARAARPAGRRRTRCWQPPARTRSAWSIRCAARSPTRRRRSPC